MHIQVTVGASPEICAGGGASVVATTLQSRSSLRNTIPITTMEYPAGGCWTIVLRTFIGKGLPFIKGSLRQCANGRIDRHFFLSPVGDTHADFPEIEEVLEQGRQTFGDWRCFEQALIDIELTRTGLSLFQPWTPPER